MRKYEWRCLTLCTTCRIFDDDEYIYQNNVSTLFTSNFLFPFFFYFICSYFNGNTEEKCEQQDKTQKKVTKKIRLTKKNEKRRWKLCKTLELLSWWNLIFTVQNCNFVFATGRKRKIFLIYFVALVRLKIWILLLCRVRELNGKFF